jgi:hypothetical protein
MFSDLTGRFPATAMDVSQYILLSVYKRYIHLELLPNRTETSLIIGHYTEFQVLDNEAPKGLQLPLPSQQNQIPVRPPVQQTLQQSRTCNGDRVSDEAGAGRLEAGGRGVGAGRPAELDRVVAKALGSGCLGWEDRMPDRAIVMCPRAAFS